jgi:hypothetical protein
MPYCVSTTHEGHFMNSEIELKLLKEIEELRKEVNLLKSKDKIQIPTYQYSKIRDTELKTLFEIEKKLNPLIFDNWFNNDICLTEEIVLYLQQLIEQNGNLIEDYNEEDLKIYYITPLLNKINFLLKDKEIRGFYELPMTYKTSQFILNGYL